MRIAGRIHSKSAIIRNAEDARSAIIPWNILEQPLDGIVGIGGLIRGFPIALFARWPRHLECPLRIEPAPNVLEYEDVAIFRKRAKVVPSLRVLSSHSVRRPFKYERQGLFAVVRAK